jgi:hypothetical protein
MAGLVLVSFLIVDLLLRPRVLVALPTLVCVVAALSLFLFRDMLLLRFGVLPWVVLLLGLTTLAWLVVRRGAYGEVLEKIARVVEPLAKWRSRAGETVSDLVTLGLVWIAVHSHVVRLSVRRSGHALPLLGRAERPPPRDPPALVHARGCGWRPSVASAR